MQFDRPQDPSPLPASLAVARGSTLINMPVTALLLSGCALAYAVLKVGVAILSQSQAAAIAAFLFIAGFVCAWGWWSYYVPRWRQWALDRGAEPDELQFLAVQAKLVWPRGSLFAKTEFRPKR